VLARPADRRRTSTARPAAAAAARLLVVPALIAVLVQRQILPSLATCFFIFTGSRDAPRIALAAL
jgi:hypothetical protein